MSVEEWLESLRSKSTKKVYIAGLRCFVREISNNADFNKFIEQYVSKSKDDIFQDLLVFAQSLIDKPPKTAFTYMGAVKNFLEFTLDYEFSKKQRRLLRNKMPRGKRARTVEDSLTRERLGKILTHCDAKGKSLFLFLVSSGIRIGEALQLELDDIDLESEPVKVNVRGEYTKTGDKYYSFISKEARDTLEEWLKNREQYLKVAVKRGIGLSKTAPGRGVKSVDDRRIFPFSFAVASSIWNRALRDAKLENHDKSTNRRTLHIHMLRKFFNSHLKGMAKLPRAIVEALMGHEEGLAAAYDRFTEKQIRDWYVKGEPYLTISMPKEIRELKIESDRKYGELAVQNIDLGNRIKKLEQRIETERYLSNHVFFHLLGEMERREIPMDYTEFDDYIRRANEFVSECVREGKDTITEEELEEFWEELFKPYVRVQD